MPWEIPPVPELRLALVHSVRSAGLSVAEAARRFGVSRKTAHKWLARHDAEPERSLADRSRRPAKSPRRTPEEAERAVLEARDRFGWGPRKLHAWLARQGRPAPPTRTVADDHSRYLLWLRPYTDMTFATVQAALWDLFGDVGLPAALLCDNAFSARTAGVGLSSFDAWLVRLGIDPMHGRFYHPQTQGKVERFHGTLEAEVWPRARRDEMAHFAADLEAWRPVYNAERPHEALGDEPPVTRWRPSERRRPDRVPEATYPAGSTLRRVGQVGEVHWRSARILAGRGLAGEWVRVEERDGQVELYYCTRRIRCLAVAELTRDKML